MRAPVLQRAIDHALDCVQGVSSASLSLSTPCAGWDLRMLLHHLGDAFDVLEESVFGGSIAAVPAVRDHADPAAAFRERAEGFLDGCSRLATGDATAGGATAGDVAAGDVTAIGDRRLPTEAVLLTVALEIAVHGWDIARARGERKAVPDGLALELLLLAPLLVDDTMRPVLFGAPVPVPRGAPAGDRLVAFLGRDPAW